MIGPFITFRHPILSECVPVFGHQIIRTLLVRRIFDIALSLPGLIALYPFVYFARSAETTTTCQFRKAIRSLPSVFAGTMSFVGHPAEHDDDGRAVFIDKPGLTGLAQLRQPESLSRQEVVTLSMHYARNYSIFLDVEILSRSMLRCIRNKNQKQPGNANHGEDRTRV